MNSFKFPSDMCDSLITSVLNKIKVLNNPILSELQKNYSYEGGFELPLSNNYFAANPDITNNQHIKYHNTRQLRFVKQNGDIIGLRLKDNIPYWSEIELKELEKLIHEELNNCIMNGHLNVFIHK